MTTTADLKTDPKHMTFGKNQQDSSKPSKPSRSVDTMNKQALSMLPPEVEGPNFGYLFVEIGNLDWLTYDG